MQTLINIRQGSKFANVDLSPYSDDLLKSVSNYYKGISAGTVEVVHFFEQYGDITDVDRTFLKVYVQKKQSTSFLQVGKFEELAWPKKAVVTYSKEKILVKAPEDDEPQEISNTYVPLHGIKVRQGSQNILVMVGSFFDLKVGNLVQIPQEGKWKAWFKFENAQVNLHALDEARGAVLDTIKSCSFGVQALNEQKTLSGFQFLQFFGTVLAMCPYVDYLALHTVYCIRFLNALVVKTKKDVTTVTMRTVEAEDNKMVALIPRSITKVREEGSNDMCKGAIVQLKKAIGHDPYLLVAGMVPSFKGQVSKGSTFEEAYYYFDESLKFRGGNGRGLGALTSCLGYAGLMSETTRSVVRYVSLINAVIAQKKMADVKVTVGVFNALSQSFRDRDVADPTVRFLVEVNERQKIDPSLHYMLTHERRKDSVLVWDMSASARSFRTGESYIVQADREAKDIIAAIHRPAIVVRQVYSAEYWKSFNVFRLHPFVDDFSAVVSTIPWSQTGGDDCPVIPSFQLFIEEQIRNNKLKNGFFLNPVSSFSPWVNNIKGPTSGMRMSYVEDVGWNVQGELDYNPEEDPDVESEEEEGLEFNDDFSEPEEEEAEADNAQSVVDSDTSASATSEIEGPPMDGVVPDSSLSLPQEEKKLSRREKKRREREQKVSSGSHMNSPKLPPKQDIDRSLSLNDS